jgi:protein-S-isoprenylcysteine O-methyltransferase Ste14
MHGDVLGLYAYGFWNVVLANVFFFLIFAVGFLEPKKRYEWRSMGALTGFLLALFTEMYGFPLTVFLLTSLMGDSYPALFPFTHSSGHLLLLLLGLSASATAMATLHWVSNGLVIFGGIILFCGWMKIHGAREGVLVDKGIYSVIRHPQYVGVFITTIGFLIQWPGLLSLIMWPILMFAYYRLAKREEGRLLEEFGAQFLIYKSRVPAFVPSFRRFRPSRNIIWD